MGNECSCNKNPEENEQTLIIQKGYPKNTLTRQENLNKTRSESKLPTYKELINQNPELFQKYNLLKSHFLAYKYRQETKKILELKHNTEQQYFKYSELIETLSKTPLSECKQRKSTYKYKSHALYSGEWLGGFRHGKGTMTWEDGVTYDGEWSFGFAEGEGLLTYPNGDYMKGKFMYNKLNGYGELHYNDTGYDYYGNFLEDCQSGEGKETWGDGSYYEGYYEMGKKDGVGKYKWKDGSFYHGEWKDNKIHGLGIYDWGDGRIYIGGWRNSKLSGFGLFIWKDGKEYRGEYKDDKKWNFGIYKELNGRRYEGFFENGVKSKLGKYIKKDGSFKIGYSKDNQLQEIITDDNEIGVKLTEIDSLVEETLKKVSGVIDEVKKLIPDFQWETINLF